MGLGQEGVTHCLSVAAAPGSSVPVGAASSLGSKMGGQSAPQSTPCPPQVPSHVSTPGFQSMALSTGLESWYLSE